MSVTVTTAEPFVVVKGFVKLPDSRKGVMSKKAPPERMYNFKFVPKAPYTAEVEIDFQSTVPRATPNILVEMSFDHPPSFSGNPSEKRTLSQSFQYPSLPVPRAVVS